MKEIGKLLELLNEYSKNIGYFNEEDLQGQTKAWILSKEFGWVKWLVENDKIDRDRCECRQLYNALKRSEDMHGDKNFSKCERVIMLLSISDTPIEDLLLYLK